MREPPEALLVGQDEAPMVPVPGGEARVHREVLPALQALQAEASRAGFALEVGSGFRSFARQLHIWNAKARGERPVLDAQERPVQLAALPPLERVHAILRWSALPGASRHHWGTDLDVFDRAALAPGAAFEMRAEETAPGGPFAPMHAWLDANLHRFGFFRPYAQDLGGVSPERWHLSYAPLALPLQRAHSPGRLARALEAAQVELGDVVLRELDALYARYVDNVSLPGVA
ncbi:MULTISPECIES: M15 family metallopeptidase [Myxococcaceae]|uniref:M15 family metallopeptidase n=1 Tax=Myxococcaceae TaxID=31 RepID=UPI00188E7640|nr:MULTISPECIES: M15 family metallopeptidase [Myxococcaceae]MBF5042154.1 M15 family metallopeptidase [Simulacricoccus sp. 17bor-14]